MRWLVGWTIACAACHAAARPEELPPVPRLQAPEDAGIILVMPDAEAPDAAMPDAAMRTCNDCDPPLRPVTGRVIKVQIDGSRTILWVGIGEAAGISKSWRGVMVRADGVAVPGGDVTTLRVAKTVTIVESTLTTGQIIAGLSVRFDPPR